MFSAIKTQTKSCLSRYLYSDETGQMLNFLTLRIENTEVATNF